MTFIEFIKNNLIHVLPIIISGTFALAIVLERLKALYQQYPIQNVEQFFKEVTKLVNSGKVSEAVRYCERYAEKPVAKIVKTALTRSHLPESLIEDGLQMAMTDAAQKVQRRTSFLATIANVATLLGLLGTILGLIHSFEAVGHADAQQKSALLSAGIASAMNATMMGLGVAIPCMIAFSFLTSRTNLILSQIEDASVRSMDILKQRFYQIDTDPEEESAKKGAL